MASSLYGIAQTIQSEDEHLIHIKQFGDERKTRILEARPHSALLFSVAWQIVAELPARCQPDGEAPVTPWVPDAGTARPSGCGMMSLFRGVWDVCPFCLSS